MTDELRAAAEAVLLMHPNDNCPAAQALHKALLDGVTFPDADTERAVRLGMSWPGSIEDDIAAMPADAMFRPEGTR